MILFRERPTLVYVSQRSRSSGSRGQGHSCVSTDNHDRVCCEYYGWSIILRRLIGIYMGNHSMVHLVTTVEVLHAPAVGGEI